MGKKRNNTPFANSLAEGGLAMFAKRPAFRRQGRKFDLSEVLAADGPGHKNMQFRRHEVIFTEGAPCNHVYYIERGGVTLTITSMTGKQAVLGLFGAGDFFGEGGLAGTKQRFSSASAATDCRLVRMENRWMSKLLSRDRAFSDFFTAYLLMRKARVEADLVDQILSVSEKRLARALLVMAGYANNPQPGEEKLPRISQETLAAMVGTTRARVSFFMNRFRKLGYVRYNGGIEVLPSLVEVLFRD